LEVLLLLIICLPSKMILDDARDKNMNANRGMSYITNE
jgi:hypothetical protein